MKSLLLVALVVAAIAATNAADNAAHLDAPVVDIEGYYRHGHHGDGHHDGHHGKDGGDDDDNHCSWYCCYRVKKELLQLIETDQRVVAAAFVETKKSIKSNFDRVVKMEKRLEEQEGFDYEKLQSEVVVLTTVVGGLDDEIVDLKGVEKKHHEEIVSEIARLGKRIGKDESGIHLEIQNVADDVEDVTSDLAATKSRLDDAENEISALINSTESLDGRLGHVANMTMKAFEEVDARIANVSSAVSEASAKGDANAASIGSLGGRLTTAEEEIATLVEKTNATANSLGALTTSFDSAVERFDGVVENQGAELSSLKNAQGALESVVNALESESAGNSTLILANADAISAVQRLVNEQGEKIADNAKAISEVRGQLKQLGDSVAALRENLHQHRDDVVEQMKKLTEAIAE